MSGEAADTRSLRSEIEAQGRARVEAIRRAAETRVAEMKAQAERDAEHRRREAMRAPERELRRALAHDLAQARIAGERRVLESRAALLDRVFAAARERLTEASETPAAHERLVERAREALELVPEGEAAITCSAGIAELLKERLELDEDTRIETRPDLPTGFQVTAAGGALVIDATLERLLELGRPALAIAVLRMLEGGTA